MQWKNKMENKKDSAAQKKIGKVMHEFKEGALHAGKSDNKVTDRKQALAIALSEAEEIKESKNKN